MTFSVSEYPNVVISCIEIFKKNRSILMMHKADDAASVISFMDQKGINYVKKLHNPPNVPECRPIENFWGILKGLVYANNWQTSNLIELKARIQQCLKKIDLDFEKRTLASTRLKLG